MLSFFGLRKDQSKKPSAERELDGFVIIGETLEEQRQKMQSMSISQPSTNVIIQPAKVPRGRPLQPEAEVLQGSPAEPAAEVPGTMSAHIVSAAASATASSSLPELLADVPFTLAPHILAMQAGRPLLPDVILTAHDLTSHNMDCFRYDFTLENSVLNEP